VKPSTVQVSPKGQVTLPVEMRRALGLKAGDRVTVTVERQAVVVRKAATQANPVLRLLEAQLSEWAGENDSVYDEL